MTQSIITLLIVATAVIYTFYSVVNSLRGKKVSKCSGCPGCELKNSVKSYRPVKC